MYILFDIGGTNTRVGLSKNGRKIDSVNIFPTSKDFQKEMELIKESALELSGGKKIQAAAGGIGASLNKAKSGLANPLNVKFPGWAKKSLKKELEKIFGAKVYLENDCTMVGLGEAHYGAGEGQKIVAYLTVSTGVGGTRIVNGQVDASALGFEPGRQIIMLGRKKSNLEDLISGMALEKKHKQNARSIGDAKTWEQVAEILAVGVNNTILYWSPDVVVLGGSVMKKVSLLNVKINLKRMLKIFPNLPLIKKAELGDLGGLHGALYYLNNLVK